MKIKCFLRWKSAEGLYRTREEWCLFVNGLELLVGVFLVWQLK